MIDCAAEKAAGCVAFRCDQNSITYEQLVARANQLADCLIDAGVQRGDRVGIYMPRCVETAVAVYGIMKAGAAYVPLDPHAPVDTLRDVIASCKPRCLVTSGMKSKRLGQLASSCPQLEAVIGSEPVADSSRWVSWDDVAAFSAEASASRHVGEHDLAYVMFTSGSTGKPKGIMHTHFSGLSYARLSRDTYGVSAEDVIGSHSPLHFDMSTFGYFTGPLATASTILIPQAHTRLPASLSQLMESERITIWYSVPYALIQLHLRGVLELRDLTCLRWVLYGGEPFPPGHLRELMLRWPHARFSNVYGPAEVNQCTFFHLPDVTPDSSVDESAIPIGKVWAETEGLVLDENDHAVEPGESGELLIRSSTMMQGYWERPDLNERAFFYDDADPDRTKAFYRTGDIVSVREDNNYVFIGRKDRQVKVRGYRVELDAVENALSSHSEVEEVGTFSACGNDDMRVVLAAVTVRSDEVTEDELIAFVLGKLPWYAVPSQVEIVTTLPRTTSGKIDRRGLAADWVARNSTEFSLPAGSPVSS